MTKTKKKLKGLNTFRTHYIPKHLYIEIQNVQCRKFAVNFPLALT